MEESNVEQTPATVVPSAGKKEKYTKNQWITISTLAFGNFCAGCCLSLQAPFFPREAELKGATSTEYGFIFGVFQLTIFIAAPLMGKLVSYVEPTFMLNAGIFTTGLTCILFGFLRYINGRIYFVTLAFVLRIVEGVGAAALRTSCYTIIAAQFPTSMTTMFGSLETFVGIGLIIGPTLGGALYDLGGFGLPFYVVGSLLFIDAGIIFMALQKPERPSGAKRGKLWKFLAHPSTVVYAFGAFTTFYYLGFNQATLEPHLRKFQLPGTHLGLIFGIPGLFFAISAPFVGWCCDKPKCNLQFIAMGGNLLMITSLLLIGPMSFLKLETTLATIIIALLLVGFGIGLKIFPAFTGSVRDSEERGLPRNINTYALISSTIVSAETLGAFIGPSVGGYLLDTKGYNTGVVVVLILEMISLTCYISYAFARKWILLKNLQTSEQQPILRYANTS